MAMMWSDRLASEQLWLNAATLVFTAWLAVLFLDASVLPGVSDDMVAIGLPASVVLFGIGFGLFVRHQKRS